MCEMLLSYDDAGINHVMRLPASDNRLAVYGPTGCGKTVLCETLLPLYDNVVKLDFKHHLVAHKGDLVVDNLTKLRKAMEKQDNEPRTQIIYRVPRESLLKENSASLDAVPALAMERGHTLLYYDDVVYVAGATDYQQRAPNFFYALTVGRGKGVGVWCVSQRPALIPISVHTESDLRITFYLRRDADRKRVEEAFGSDEIPWETMKVNKYSFVMGNDLAMTAPQKITPNYENARSDKIEVG